MRLPSSVMVPLVTVPRSVRNHIERGADGQGREEQQEEIELPLRSELISPQGGPRHLDRGLRAAGDGRRVIDDPLDDELACQRGDGKIKALDAQARNADDRPDQRRRHAAGRQRDPEWQPEHHPQIRRPVGAH